MQFTGHCVSTSPSVELRIVKKRTWQPDRSFCIRVCVCIATQWCYNLKKKKEELLYLVCSLFINFPYDACYFWKEKCDKGCRWMLLLHEWNSSESISAVVVWSLCNPCHLRLITNHLHLIEVISEDNISSLRLLMCLFLPVCLLSNHMCVIHDKRFCTCSNTGHYGP